MQYFNICTKRTYEVGGEKKVKWLKCGTLKILGDGKKFIELTMFPNTSFYVFEQKQKGEIQEDQNVSGL